MRNFAAFLLALLLTPPLAAQELVGWWYPDGNPEATRQSLGKDTVTAAERITIKWRTTTLAASPQLLVGRLDSTRRGQQIVGLSGDTLVVLSSRGLPITRFPYDSAGYFPTPFSLHLTGLFNPGNQSRFIAGSPAYIGVGVTRAPQSPQDTLSAFLADLTGRRRRIVRLGGPLPESIPASGRTMRLSPVAAYLSSDGPTVLATLEQVALPASADTVVAGLLRFVFPEVPSQQQSVPPVGGYPIAPSVAQAQPPLYADLLATPPRRYVVLPTAARLPSITVTPPSTPAVRGVPTESDALYSVDLRDSAGVLQNVETTHLASTTGSSRSYITPLSNTPVSEDLFRLITEDHSPADPGQARLIMKSLLDPSAETFGIIAPPEMRNVGWRIVTADLDGAIGNALAPDYPNNTNDEVIGASMLPGDPDIPGNMLRVYRWMQQFGDTLSPFAAHSFDGRLMGGGDLVKDDLERRELLLANGNRLTIIQMLRYDEFLPDDRVFFRTVATIDLDSRIISAVIADLDLDGGNDIVASTERSTYAIGLRQPQPFDTLGSLAASICHGDTLSIAWRRQVGGGEAGVRLSLLGADGETLIADSLAGGAGPARLDLSTDTLAAGLYRLRLVDRIVPSVADTSLPFEIAPRSIEGLALVSGSLEIGEVARLEATVACVDSVLLERSIDGGAWSGVDDATVQLSGGGATIATTIPCPTGYGCSARDTVVLSYRLRDASGRGTSNLATIAVPLPRPRLTVEPGDTSRSRMRRVEIPAGAFPCGTIEVAVSDDDGATWRPLPPATTGSYDLDVPTILSGTLLVRFCCDAGDAGCTSAFLPIEVSPLPDGSYVAPNPFNPLGGGEMTARIVFMLAEPGEVTVRIYDAGRRLVTTLVERETMTAGRQRLEWSGRREGGEPVADGAYICVITSTGGDHLTLPIYVLKR